MHASPMNMLIILAANLLQTYSVQLCHFVTYCLIHNTQYMLATHAEDLLCLQLHTALAQTVCAILTFSLDTPSCSLSKILQHPII
jgi:hypothetical protein